jgi:hypothetical protein
LRLGNGCGDSGHRLGTGHWALGTRKRAGRWNQSCDVTNSGLRGSDGEFLAVTGFSLYN